MKINWGHKIFMVYALFVIGILVLSYKSSQQKFDLVQEDYYGAELKYQSVIDASKRANDLGGEMMLTQNQGKLFIQLPAFFEKEQLEGEAHLYCVADAKNDRVQKIKINNGRFEMELLSTTKGNYTLKLSLENKGLAYYFEKKVKI